MSEEVVRRVWALLCDASLRSLFLLAVAGVTLLCLRRSSAAMRHLVLLLTIACLLCLPLVSASLPGWHVAVWPQTAHIVPSPPVRPDVPPITSDPAKPAAPLPSDGPSAAVTPPIPKSPHVPLPVVRVPMRSDWPLIGLCLWAAGVCAVLLPVLAGLAAVRRLGRQSLLVTAAPTTDLASDLARQLGLYRRISLRQSVGVDSPIVPMTWGWRRPVILVPPDSEEWPMDRLRVVLLHELAHIQRRDWLWQMLAHGVCALYWFHPGVWLVARHLRLESERACDNQVLSAGVPASDYAKHLVDVARSLSQTKPLATVALPMARLVLVSRRIEAILAIGQNRRRVRPFAAALAFIGSFGLLFFVGGLRPMASAQMAGAGRLDADTHLHEAKLADEVTLSHGVTVTLVGVTRLIYQPPGDKSWTYSKLDRLWWKSDGMPSSFVSSAKPESFGGPLDAAQFGRAFAFRFSGRALPTPDDKNYEIEPAGGGMSVWPDPPTDPTDRQDIVLADFSKGVARCDIRCGLASGPWTTFGETNGWGVGSTSGMQYGVVGSVLFAPAGEWQHGVMITVSDTLQDRERRVVAVTTKGQTVVGEPHGGYVTLGSLRQETVIFPHLSLAQIKIYRFQSRPYEWAEFKNVVLEPRTIAADDPVQAKKDFVAAVRAHNQQVVNAWKRY